MPSSPPYRIVNVATVPQRSVFRYPGGKTWLVPQLRAWLGSQVRRPRLLVEPFAGGGIVGLTAVAEGLVGRALLVELDPGVAAVWRVLLQGDGEGLARRIEKFEFTEATVREELAKTVRSDTNVAFHTILRNRVQRGGIMARGAGLMKAGENDKGLGSRWYPGTLARRIRGIAEYREKIDFIEGDGLEVMSEHTNERGTVLFVDPPYTAGGKRAGARLYDAFDLEHDKVFQIARRHKGDFLLTYDNAPEVRALAAQHGLVTREIAMRSTHNSEMTELLIGRDLSWVR